jgi:phosphoglycerate dehydrogenase-like enzyme
MTDDPTVAMLHTVNASHWVDHETLREALLERLPDLDLRVATTPGKSKALVADAEIAVSCWLPDDLYARADDLQWVQAVSAGVGRYDVETLHDDGVLLTNVSGAVAEPIAQHVIGFVLLFERRLLDALEQQRNRQWVRYQADELGGKRIGIVGVGEIGGSVAEYAATFGMEVHGLKRDTSTVHDAVDEVYAPDELDALLTRSDYVVVSCPLTERTRGLLGETELGLMKSSAVLVNVARGPIVDEEALLYALRRGTLRGAALDVTTEEPLPPDSPLWEHPNVVVTPHVAGSSPKKYGRYADVFETNYRAYTSGRVAEMTNVIGETHLE